MNKMNHIAAAGNSQNYQRDLPAILNRASESPSHASSSGDSSSIEESNQALTTGDYSNEAARQQFPRVHIEEDGSRGTALDFGSIAGIKNHRQNNKKSPESSFQHCHDQDSNNSQDTNIQQHQESDSRAREQERQQDHNEYDEVKHVELFGVRIVALTINGKERLCLAQISNTLLKEFSYNEIHNRRVALGITCVQCTPVQLEMLRRAGAMPSSSRRCGMITMREAERLCRSFLVEEQPPELPENFYFTVAHRVNYGCKGRFIPARYISSRAKCIECFYCGEFYSPNKFIFHSHKQPNITDCNPPDSPNINSWRKHIDLDWTQEHSQEIKYAWEDVKSLFNGGTRRRAPNNGGNGSMCTSGSAQTSATFSQKSASGTKQMGPIQDEDQLIDVEFDEVTMKRDNGSDPESNDTAISLADKRKSIGCWLQPQRESKQNRTNRQTGSQMSNPISCASQQHRTDQQHPLPVKRPAHNAGNQLNKRFATSSIQRNQMPTVHDEAQINRATMAPFQSATGSPGTITNGRSAFSNQLQATSVGQSMLVGDHPMNRMTRRSGHGDGPTTDEQINKALGPGVSYSTAMPNASTSFIYSQLYSQLMQPQVQQQANKRPQFSGMDAQLALRHHIWSSLLANLQCNAAAAVSANNRQTQQTYSLPQPAPPSQSSNLAVNNQCGPQMAPNGETDISSSVSNFSLGMIPTQIYSTQAMAATATTTVASFNNDNSNCK